MSVSFEARRYMVFTVFFMLGTLYTMILLRGGFRQLSTTIPISAEFEPSFQRQNATLVFLARNSDLRDVLTSMSNLERRFNHNYLYPWVFLNDEEFTNEFKGRVLLETNAPVYFGLIPKEHWVQPAWIDEDKAEESRKRLKGQNIIYGGAHLYPDTILATKTILNIWQIAHPIEICAASTLGPNVDYFCDMNHDPFQYLNQNNQTYGECPVSLLAPALTMGAGFTIALYETPETVTTLWDSVKGNTNL
ncbi:hypothetical protein HHX47_DHR4000680 [Lentinula edodes]|nr:hypothetical protein HHX47_DHR4000680 [Lentinula edodes]